MPHRYCETILPVAPLLYTPAGSQNYQFISSMRAAQSRPFHAAGAPPRSGDMDWRLRSELKMASTRTTPPLMASFPVTGQWQCVCEHFNFYSYTSCKRCDAPRHQQLKGDWKCTHCNHMNFASRAECGLCSSPHPNGDWACVNCHTRNYPSRMVCYTCQAPRSSPADPHADEMAQMPSAIVVICVLEF